MQDWLSRQYVSIYECRKWTEWAAARKKGFVESDTHGWKNGAKISLPSLFHIKLALTFIGENGRKNINECVFSPPFLPGPFVLAQPDQVTNA